jgi:hypothetical protein
MRQLTNPLTSRERGSARAPGKKGRGRQPAFRLEVESLEARCQVSALLSQQLSPFADVLLAAAVAPPALSSDPVTPTPTPPAALTSPTSTGAASPPLADGGNAAPAQTASGAAAAAPAGTASATPPSGDAAVPGPAPTWSVQVGTAAGIPQDIWITAEGNNVDGWQGAGSIALVGPLPEGGVGVRTVAVVDSIEQGGIVGVDGTPVAPGTYTAPGITEPTIQFDVVAGQTFYVVFHEHIANTNFPLFHVGEKIRAMFTFNTVLGHTDQNLINWADFGTGLQPFLNEGTMMTNIHQRP